MRLQQGRLTAVDHDIVLTPVSLAGWVSSFKVTLMSVPVKRAKMLLPLHAKRGPLGSVVSKRPMSNGPPSDVDS
ncbi:hypothetical protein Tdes44962_MAKER05569 [Teratosphaeria destructans]|uniref:Uncharacterized protein n=1 Tax=Teratosphaeria destructans TaxID=418781 RepID=A0A9W7SJS4_9PEZI|nr:hypothetical protein Tdes44962_MAKER05569 [Teratosphaeria destructans]